MAHMQPKQERTWYLDLLRIAATFAVVMIHTNPFSFSAEPSFTASYWIGTVISSACRFAVPVFFMISGVLFLSPERTLSTARLYKKTILRMVASYLFWSALHALSYCISTNMGKWAFLNELLRGHYHMWFILVITGLYILTPLIRQITQNPRATRYLLTLCLILGFLVPRLPAFLLLFDFAHKDVVQSLQSMASQMNPLSESYALFYYVLGHYLHENPPGRKLRRLIALGGIAGLLMTVLFSAMHLALGHAFDSYFYDARAIGPMLMGVAVFTGFNRFFSSYRPSAPARRVILHLSVCSFGVYAVHVLILEHISWKYPLTPCGTFAGIVLHSLMVYAFSHAVSALLHRIPVLRSWIV